MAQASPWLKVSSQSALIFVAVALSWGSGLWLRSDLASASAGGMARMLIDMDPEDGAANGPGVFAPVNDWSSFGAVQECARMCPWSP